MSEETPPEGGADTPVPSEQPTAAESAAVESPPDVPVTPAPAVAEEPVTEPAPAAPAPAAAPAPTAAVAPPPAAAPAAEPHRRGVFVPMWVGAILLVLAVAALGFGIGRWTADDSSSSNAASFNPGRIFPQFPGNGNNGNGNGNGNGNNGNGNGNGGSQTTPANVAFLGVSGQSANGGVQLTDVGDNTPAAKAGLQEGDVVTAVDNTNVSNQAALAAAIQSHEPGDQVTIHYTRNGNTATAKVTLGTRPTTNSN